MRRVAALFGIVLAGCDPCSGVECGPCETCHDGFCKSPRVEIDATVAVDEVEDEAGVFVPLDPGPATPLGLGWQPVRVTAARTKGLVVDTPTPGAIELARDDGSPARFPLAIDSESEDLLVRGTAAGDAALVVDCAGDVPSIEHSMDALPLRVGPFPGLTGDDLDAYPWFDFARTVDAGAPIRIFLDASRHAERVGLAYDAAVVPHRSADEWAADSALGDASGAVESGIVSDAIDENRLDVWDAAEEGDWDVVLDFGQDGRRDPGDLVSTVSALGDPGAPGPMDTATFDYDRPTFQVRAGFDGLVAPYDVHLRGRVVHPDPVPENAPVVVFLHGNHTPLYWPDPYPSGPLRRVDADLTSDENYRGFTYLQELLASWGAVTVSVSLDDAAFAETDGAFRGAFPTPNSNGIRFRAWTALKNLEALLADPEVAGPTLGRVDAGNLHVVGHSRGGEAAVQVFRLLTVRDARPEAAGGSPEDLAGEETWAIRSVTSLSPVTFIADTPPLGDVPFLLLYGKADGDVDGYTLGARPFELYDLADGAKQALTIEGGSHNAFNTSWPCIDSGSMYFGTEFFGTCSGLSEENGADLVDAESQRAIAKAYVHAFVRAAAEDDDRWLDYFRRPADRFRPPSVPAQIPLHGQFRASVAAGGIVEVVDDFESQPDRFTSSAGQPVGSALSTLDEVDLSDTFRAASHFAQRTRGVLVGWTEDGALYEQTFAPGSRDLTAVRALSLRIAQQPLTENTRTLDADLDVTIALFDEDGAVSRIETAALVQIPDVYPSLSHDFFTLEAYVSTIAVFKTVRIDPILFLADGAEIDLTRIEKVRIELRPSVPGQIGIDDVDLAIE